MTQATLPLIDIDALVRDDEVHRDCYVSNEVFDLEMERIFGQAWVYVGHDSQIPDAGDYWTTLIGRESVVMTRDKQGEVHVLYNRCPHEALGVPPRVAVMLRACFAALPPGPSTWTASSRCPLQGGYEGTSFDIEIYFSMRKVGRVANYRGFVFASWRRRS